MLKMMDKRADAAGRARPTAKAEAKKSAIDAADKAAFPPEGPHARPELINEDATPGTGLFSTTSAGSVEVDPGAG